MNLSDNLARAAYFFPESPALSEAGTEISYKQLNERVSRVATALIKSGTNPGDHVGLCAPNCADWIAFYFGVIRAGAVAVTLSSALKGDELSLLLNHSKPKIIFTADEKLDDLKNIRASAGIEQVICTQGDLTLQRLLDMGTGSFRAVDRHPTDTAAILYTGGTTGIPKGVMLTHENINVSAHNVAFSERSCETDRALCFLPFNHVFGQIHITNATIMSAGCLEILPTYDEGRALELTSSGRVTKLFAVPTVYGRLLTLDNLKEKLGKVRYCFSAAASMAGEIVRQWKEQTGLTISEGYGMTESASAVTYNHYYRHVIGSVGTTVPGIEVVIRDTEGHPVALGEEGEICVRGHNIMKGYLDNPEETKNAFWEDGWFRSGDIGLLTDDDYLFIVDRLKDMIITGGENVYPREVEEVIYTRPEVQECAVVGLPDRDWGERVTAFIIARPGQEIIPEDLKRFLKAHLSPYKVPKQYVVLDEMPKTAAGKILKRELRKQFSS
jgi:long-chain acyl-CoA synthetase